MIELPEGTYRGTCGRTPAGFSVGTLEENQSDTPKEIRGGTLEEISGGIAEYISDGTSQKTHVECIRMFQVEILEESQVNYCFQ